MSIRAVIWDVGGVLLRTEDRTPRAQAAARLGLTDEQLEDLVFDNDLGRRAQLGEIGAQELWKEVGRRLNLPPDKLPWLVNAFFAGDRLDTSLMDFIRTLRPRYKTGVISNAWDDLIRFMTDRWQMADAFDHIIGSADVGLMKPDPRIFRLSLQGLGVEPQEAVFIDDNLANIQGAWAAGLHAIHFQSREQVLLDLKRLLES